MGVDTLMRRKAIFLDRDGVLNHAIVKNGLPFAPMSVDELTIPEDVESALQMLKAAGFLLIVVTNQPDVARGKNTKQAVEEINKKLQERLPLDEFFVCYHDNADHCHCRKPLPGLLTDAAEKHSIDMTQSFMVGDRWKDVEAGQAAGCKTILIDNEYLEQNPNRPADFIVKTLTDAALIITSLRKNDDNDKGIAS
jgi:D-glycero-D-manno-heptose 1,7-bisphosphate phosphatase